MTLALGLTALAITLTGSLWLIQVGIRGMRQAAKEWHEDQW